MLNDARFLIICSYAFFVTVLLCLSLGFNKEEVNTRMEHEALRLRFRCGRECDDVGGPTRGMAVSWAKEQTSWWRR